MAEERIQRRLSAILVADVVNFSRLMGADETGTLTALKKHRAELIDPTISNYQGRIVKLMGDGALVDFASVVDAVECAVAIQRGMEKRNADMPESSIIRFRIGVNMGDVIVDGDDIYGDGVNIAARLEAEADPGGICISDDTRRQLTGKINHEVEDLGERNLKNIATPIRVYRIVLNQTPIAKKPTEPALPDKPSIAVLPFDNMSGDPEQEYFADGIVEDIITDLSKISGLFVVARNSSSVFKGQATDIRSIAKTLGVRFVMEGSVRKSGDRVRINAQLIDAVSGGHLWADRYDGSLADVFQLQDKVCAQIVSALSVQLTGSEIDNLNTVHTSNLDAYELFVRARMTPYPPIPKRIQNAREMFTRVIELDPEFAGGYAGVSSMISFTALWAHKDPTVEINQAVELAQKAISVDGTFGWSYTALAMAIIHRHQYEEAIASARKAIALRPNDADAHAFLGLILGLDGRYQDAIERIKQAIRLNPLFINGPYLNVLGQTYGLAGNNQLAVDAFNKNIERNGPVGPPAYCWAAAAYVGLGQHEEAKQLTKRLSAEFPGFTFKNWNYLSLIRSEDVRNRITAQMREAGVAGS